MRVLIRKRRTAKENHDRSFVIGPLEIELINERTRGVRMGGHGCFCGLVGVKQVFLIF